MQPCSRSSIPDLRSLAQRPFHTGLDDPGHWHLRSLAQRPFHTGLDDPGHWHLRSPSAVPVAGGAKSHTWDSELGALSPNPAPYWRYALTS